MGRGGGEAGEHAPHHQEAFVASEGYTWEDDDVYSKKENAKTALLHRLHQYALHMKNQKVF